MVLLEGEEGALEGLSFAALEEDGLGGPEGSATSAKGTRVWSVS